MSRRAFLLLPFVISCALLSCSKSPQRSLVGEWKGTDSTGQTASMVFSQDGAVKFLFGNLVLDGATVGGSVTWRLDTHQTPTHLDIVLKPSAGQEKILPMIVRFITDQRIQIRISDDMQSRPVNFSADDSRNQLVLVKQ